MYGVFLITKYGYIGYGCYQESVEFIGFYDTRKEAEERVAELKEQGVEAYIRDP